MKLGLMKNSHGVVVAFVLLVAAILTDSLAFGQVNVEPNTALLNEGDRTELLCRYGRSINYCRIEVPGEKILNLSPDWNKTPGFTYYGAGLVAGQCGVSIDRVKAINNGQVKCYLGVEGEELSGVIDLVVALRPQQPLIELISKPDPERYFMEGSNFQARCIVRDGRPAANITWLIDNYPADKRVSQLEVLASPHDQNLMLSTTVQEIQWHLGPEDNGRKLICRSHHQTDRESVPPQEGAFLLLVRYRPIKLPEQLVYGLYLDRTAIVNITIRANPTPQVEWTVDGNVIGQGTQNGRFSVYEPQYLGQDFYNVTLVIAGLTLEDTTKTYQMRASNALGATDYQVRISSSATPPSTGLEIGAIVGIVVAIAVLIVIVLLVVFARATGRWCFGGKSTKMPTHETDKTQQQHGQQVALLETPNGVTIIGNKGASDGINGQERFSVQRRDHSAHGDDDEDNHSFEYATDRESSVYNPTTRPLSSIMSQAGGRYSQKSRSSDESTTEQEDLLKRGSQLGIPESRFSRWIPKDQREILEKQAKLLANRFQPKTPEPERVTPPLTPPAAHQQARPQETEIYSDTESADIKAASSTATTATTTAAAVATATATATDPTDTADAADNEPETEASASAIAAAAAAATTGDTCAKKSKRLPTFSAIFKRLNERKKKKRQADVEETEEAEGNAAAAVAEDASTGEGQAAPPSTDGNDNEAKENKQLVYAELVLKPSDQPSEQQQPQQPPPAQSQTPTAKPSTEYAQIVYVQKSNTGEQSQK